jgi:hypothetical protein
MCFGRPCFVFSELDCFTYLVSAGLMWLVHGTWTAADNNQGIKIVEQDSLPTSSISFCTTCKKIISTYFRMSIDGATYITTSPVLPFVLIKASGGLVWGAADPLNVRFAHVDGDVGRDSERLGFLYGSLGVACFIGPLLADALTDINRPSTVQLACLVAFGCVTIGFVGWTFSASFWCTMGFTFIRGIGVSTLWMESTFLVQVR